MNAQDMSIYWNQRKGQYETDNFYQEQQNPFTITADRRLRYQEEVDNDEDNVASGEEHVVSIASWFGTMLLLMMPGINVISILIMSFASKNENKKAFARAIILVSLVCLTVMLLFMALTCDKIDYGQLANKCLELAKSVMLKVKAKI